MPREGVLQHARVCAWCSEPSVATLTLEPDRFSYTEGADGKRIKTLRKRAITAQVCARHLKTLQLKKDKKEENVNIV